MNHYAAELVMIIGALVYVLPGPPSPPDGGRIGRLSTMGLVAFGAGLLVSLWRW